MGGICRNNDSVLLAAGGTADHVHILISLSKAVTLVELMMNLKRDASKWIKQSQPGLGDFAWQDGYFAFSIGESGVGPLRKYIAGQKEHHARIDYKMRCARSSANTAWNGTSSMCGRERRTGFQPANVCAPLRG
jgi:putative transposase